MKILFVLIVIFMTSCTMLLFRKVEVTSKDDDFYATIGYYDENGEISDNSKYRIRIFSSFDYLKNEYGFFLKPGRYYKCLNIYIGIKQIELDNFPVKPKKIKEKTINNKHYLIYSYYNGLVEHVDVYIYNGEVEKFECLLFKDGP